MSATTFLMDRVTRRANPAGVAAARTDSRAARAAIKAEIGCLLQKLHRDLIDLDRQADRLLQK